MLILNLEVGGGGTEGGTQEISCSMENKFLGLVFLCFINWLLGQHNTHFPKDPGSGNLSSPLSHMQGFLHPPPLTHLISCPSPPLHLHGHPL